MKIMKLITKALEAKFRKIGSQNGKGSEAIVVAKIFHPYSRYTLYATEYNPENREFFGYVINLEQEWGSVSLDEMQACRVRGLPMERDQWLKPMPLREALRLDHQTYHLIEEKEIEF